MALALVVYNIYFMKFFYKNTNYQYSILHRKDNPFAFGPKRNSYFKLVLSEEKLSFVHKSKSKYPLRISEVTTALLILLHIP